MERRPSRNGSRLNAGVALDNLNVQPEAEKKVVGEVGGEHRLRLDGLRYHDQTHRKLKVRVFAGASVPH